MRARRPSSPKAPIPPHRQEDWPVRELERVKLTLGVNDENRLLPAGGVGTVVHCYGPGPTHEAFEVEFDTPFHSVVTLKAEQIEAA